MPPFTTRLADGWQRGLEHLPLALVPLVTAVFATEKVQQVATFQGRHFGLRLGLPAGVVDLWQFVSLPNESIGVGVPLPEALPLLVVILPVAIVVQAGLAAGYFGSLASALETGQFDFVASVRDHFAPFLAYTLIPLVVIIPLALLGVGGSRQLVPVVLLLVPVVIVAGYLFYATPYLIVLREADLWSALRASYQLAIDGAPYLRYAAGYAGFVLAVSLVATAVVVNLGLVGVAIGVVAGAPVGLACNAATMRFVSDLDAQSPSLGDWDDDTIGGGQP